MTSRSVLPIVAVAATLCASFASHTSARAQQPVQEDRPRLVLNTLGPASRTRAVAFSRDSARLLAAGFDKTVHVWDVGWNNQGGANEPDKAAPIRTMRWEIARANRGLINAIALSPTHERIAIGGQGARGSNGDIILMNLATYEVERSLPPARDDATSLPGHRQSITFLNFSPSGTRLASVSSDGNVWIWTATTPDGSGDWIPTEIRPPLGARLFNEQPALFLTDDLLVISQPLDPNSMTQWQLMLYSLAGSVRQLGPLGEIHQGRVSTLARSPDHRLWASADSGGRILLWTQGPQPSARVLRQHDREPSALAFGPGGLTLAVSNYLDPRSQSVVELYDVASAQMLDQVATSSVEHGNAVTISPDGQFLATHADDSQEVIVYRLSAPTGEPLPRPLSTQPGIRLQSRARRVTQVAFARPVPNLPGYRIGFSHSPDRAILGEFELSNPDLIRLAEPAPAGAYLAPDTFAGGWSAVPDQNGSLVRLLFNGQDAGQIPLNVRRQGEFEGFYCIIPDAQQRPFAIAFGTTTQNGIYIYRLPLGGTPPALIRYFRDHNGEVLSVGVSPDGRYLVSGAEDQTIKIWSLHGLESVNPNFPPYVAWGADFVFENGRLVVRNLLRMGIAFNRQLREGDIIASMLIARGGQQVSLTDPREIKSTLDQHPLFESVVFSVFRNGQVVQLQTTVPGWEPLMTLLVDDRGEWALFTPEGYFDASVAEGQTLFGWQINIGRNLTPRFLQAEALQKEFERPDVLRNVLALGSVVDALQANNVPVPQDFQEALAAKAQQVPDVKIVSPLATDRFAEGQQIPIVAEITTPPQSRPDDFDVRGTLGGRNVGPPQRVQDVPLPDGRTKRTVEFQAPASDELNRIKVDIAEKGQASILNALNNSDKVFNRATPGDPATQPRRKLHFLALATDQYDGTVWPKLEYPKKDVSAIINALYEGKQETRLYEFGETLTLYNDLITPANVKTYVNQILESISPVGPKDVVLVYLSGHGKAIDNEYFYIPPLPTNDPAEIKRLAIGWPLLSVLGDAQCHVIWMLDTCQSGVVTDVKAGVRNVARAGLVVAATSGEEEAFEGERYRGGHGAFTASILDGLEGKADGAQAEQTAGVRANDRVDVQELVAYVKEAVYRATGREQEPCFTPEEIVNLAEVELTKVVATTGP